MSRIIKAILLVSIFAVFSLAQDINVSDVMDITISDTHIVENLKVLTNTENDRFLVVYEDYNVALKQISLKVTTISSTGVKGNIITLVSNIDGTGLWDVAWHPTIKKYIIIYKKDSALFSRILRATAKPKGKIKKIMDFDDTYFQITWAGSKRFVLFYSDGDPLKARLIKKNGKILGTPSVLVGGELSGDAYPVEAITQEDETPVAFFGLITTLEKKYFYPSLVKTNLDLELTDQFAFTEQIETENRIDFMGNYDIRTGNYIVSWNEPKPAPAATLMSDTTISYQAITQTGGTSVLEKDEIPNERYPINLKFNPLSERFTYLYMWQEEAAAEAEEPVVYDNRFAVMVFKPNGVLVSAGNLILNETRGPVYAANGAYDANGNYLLVWSLDEDDLKGIYARLFYN